MLSYVVCLRSEMIEVNRVAVEILGSPEELHLFDIDFNCSQRSFVIYTVY